MPHLRPEEEWCRQMVEAALGVSVSQHDDGSRPGMHDLTVHHPDGTLGAVEVTAAADPKSISLWKHANEGGARWIVPEINGGWVVSVRPSASVKRLRSELPALLHVLEDEEVGAVHRPGIESPGVQGLLASLGVVDLHQGGTNVPGSVYVLIDDDMERRAGWAASSAAEAVGWLSEYLASERLADVRRKLHRSGCAERHAFIVVPGFTTAPFGATNVLLGYGGEPQAAPVLPNQITHAWMVSTWAIGTGWRWDPGTGWLRFDTLQEQAS